MGLIIVHHLILTKRIFLKKDFLIVGEGDTFVINGSFGAPEKNLILILVKQRKKYCLSLHYNCDKTYLFVNGKEIYKLTFVSNWSGLLNSLVPDSKIAWIGRGGCVSFK